MEKALVDFLNSLEGSGIPGCDCVIYYKHKPVFRHTAGFADNSKTRPITASTTYWLFSATKVITCTAIMQLAEKGLLNLDDPVSDYLPEYGDLKVKNGSSIEPAKNIMTIRHLLTMQSGLNYDLSAPSIQKILKETNGEATTREIIKALANEPLDFEPGSRYQYSLSHDVLGAIVEVASGQRFSAYLDEYIFMPLGMNNTGFELTPERKANMSDQFEYDMDTKTSKLISLDNCYVLSENYESGGAGLISTTDDYIKFLDAMCNDGTGVDGYRILSTESLNQMRSNQLHETSKEDFRRSMGKIGYSYGLGVRTHVDKKRSRAKSPLGEFGWDGAAGAYGLIDVDNNVAVFYVQHVRGCGYGYEVIHPKIRDLAYEFLGITN